MTNEDVDAAWRGVQDALPAGWHLDPPIHDRRRGVWSVTAVGPQANSETPWRVTGTGDTDIRALTDLASRLSPIGVHIAGLPSFSIRRPWSPARRLTRNTRWALGGVALGLLVSALILVLFRCPDEGAQVIFGLLVMGTIALAVLGAVSFFLSRHVSALLLGACLGLVTAFILIFLVFAQYIPGC